MLYSDKDGQMDARGTQVNCRSEVKWQVRGKYIGRKEDLEKSLFKSSTSLTQLVSRQ